MLDVGTIRADPGHDGLAGVGVRADDAGQGKEPEGALEVDRVGGHAARQGGAFWFLFFRRLSQLHVGAVRSVPEGDGKAARWVGAEVAGTAAAGAPRRVAVGHRQGRGVTAIRVVRAADEGAELAELEVEAPIAAGEARPRVGAALFPAEEMGAEEGIQGIQHVPHPEPPRSFHGDAEGAPEVAQHRLPFDAPARDVVELVLEVGGKAILHVTLEKAGQERGDQAPAVLGDEAALVEAHVIAVLQHRKDAGVGRGAADAVLLQALDQAGLGIARRRLGEMLFRHDGGARHGLALADVGQDAFGLVVAVFVASFLVKAEETVECHHRAGGAQLGAPVRRGHVNGHLVEHRVRHLAGHGAFPDEVVKPRLVLVQARLEIAWPAGDVGGADGLVRLLGVLGLGFVDARRIGHVGRAVGGIDLAPAGGDGLAGHLDAVGPHIGDQADGFAADVDALVKPLGDLHGVLGAEVQLARRFLLQRRRGERRRRVAPDLLAVDRGHGEDRRLDGGDRRRRRGFAAQGHLVQLVAVEVGEVGAQAGAARRLEVRRHRPVFLRREVLDLGFAVAHQAQRHRLHAARRAASRQFAPQHRRQREPDQIVEGAPGQVGVDEFAVELARVGEGVEHRALGDFVEHHALDIDALEHVLLVQHLAHVPRDGLALAVRVGGEIEVLGTLDGVGDLVQVLAGLAVDLPVHGEVVVGAHRAVLGRQVAHVAVAGQHGIARAQVLVDGLGLGRRLDDDDVHGIPLAGFEQRYLIAGMALQASRQLQFQQDHGHHGRGEMAISYDLVN